MWSVDAIDGRASCIQVHLANDLNTILHEPLVKTAHVDVAPLRSPSVASKLFIFETDESFALGALGLPDEIDDPLERDLHANEVGARRDRVVRLGEAEVLHEIVIPGRVPARSV